VTRANRGKAASRHLAKAHAALEDADVLLGASRFEAAASRSYYCCFHAARAALARLGLQPRTHKGVNERFNLDIVVPGRIEAEYLSALGRTQAHRELADYGVEDELPADTARTDVAEARRFLQRVERFIGELGDSGD
jgi:uncharacterized protein (UPF0332 family)